ncbi:alpha/beta hydrolase [Streptomyces hirsutus]
MAVRLNAHRTVVFGAEHSPAVERPEPTAHALATFWDGLQAPHNGTATGTAVGTGARPLA